VAGSVKPRVEQILADALAARYGTPFITEHVFHAERKWRFDVAIPSLLIGVEIQGYRSHSRASAMRRDAEKYDAAVEAGWKVLIYPADAVLTKKRLARIVEQIGRVAGGQCEEALSGCVLTGE
jgi:hypothetical protein